MGADHQYVMDKALDFLFWINSFADRDPHDLPQLTLLDLKLPKMDGLKVLRRIRANEHTCGLPIVLFSSSKERQDLIDGYRGGANSYVRKAVDFTQFVESIRQIGSYWLELNEAPPN